MKKRRQFLLGIAVGVVLALIILPLALGHSWYLGIVIFRLAALALALLIMTKMAGKLSNLIGGNLGLFCLAAGVPVAP